MVLVAARPRQAAHLIGVDGPLTIKEWGGRPIHPKDGAAAKAVKAASRDESLLTQRPGTDFGRASAPGSRSRAETHDMHGFQP